MSWAEKEVRAWVNNHLEMVSCFRRTARLYNIWIYFSVENLRLILPFIKPTMIDITTQERKLNLAYDKLNPIKSTDFVIALTFLFSPVLFHFQKWIHMKQIYRGEPWRQKPHGKVSSLTSRLTEGRQVWKLITTGTSLQLSVSSSKLLIEKVEFALGTPTLPSNKEIN